MRLTLRTLLAYLDEILEADDAEQLRQKIQESEMATQLVHRIRHVVGQLRSDAAPPWAEGVGKDANFVAEYLDNTMPPEKVAEFERLCLESDSLLAEVAACHQILTLVLGEPADVASELKDRIYRLPHASDAQKRASVAAATPPAAAQVGAAPPVQPAVATTPIRVRSDEDEHWTEAPDYLKKHRTSRWKPVAIATLIAFFLVLAGLRGMGPFDRSHPLAQWLGFGPDTVAQQGVTTETPDQAVEATPAATDDRPPNGESTAAVEPPESEPALEASGDAVAQPDQSMAPGFESKPPMADTQSVPETEGPAVPPTAVESAESTRGTEQPPEPGVDQAEPTGAEPMVQTPETEPAVDEPDSEPTMNIPEGSGIAQPANVASSESPTLINPLAPHLPDSEPAGAAGPTAPIPPMPEDLSTAPSTESRDNPPPTPEGPATAEAGRFLSEDQLLLRYDSASQLWQRLPSRSPLLVGELLLALPTYRPQVMLPTGMQLTLIGPTRAVIEPSDPDETPHLRLEFGRVTVITFARAGTKIHFSWNGRSAVASFADMDTILAIELKREQVPGTNPEETDPHVVLRVYPASGSIEWQMDDSPAYHVPSGQRLIMVDGGPARLDEVETLPEWIDGRDARPRDPIAARGLEPNVTADRSVALSLKEQADSKRYEVRSLAAISLAYLGEYDPLLLALNDSGLKSYWSDEFRVLRESVALDRETATRVRQAIEQRHRDDGDQLYRILWGYTAQELDEGEAEELVQYLDHPSSDFRVAAIETLKEITGTTSLYLPHFTEAQRRSAIFKWREKLNAGQIRYAEVPEIVGLIELTAPAP